jgi:hypothetical protein
LRPGTTTDEKKLLKEKLLMKKLEIHFRAGSNCELKKI